MKKYKLSIVLSAISGAGLIACNSGSGIVYPPQPPQPKYPLIYDYSQIKELTVTILTESNQPIIGALNRTKVGGHVDYKLKITNPNNFALTISNMAINTITSNPETEEYLLHENNKSDNCFNQSWYKESGNGSYYMMMQPNATCSFYVTSPWIERYYTSFVDSSGPARVESSVSYFNYTANAGTFGFETDSVRRINMWCESGCEPIGMNAESKDNYTHTDNPANIIVSKYMVWRGTEDVYNTYNLGLPESDFLLSGTAIYANQNMGPEIQIYNIYGYDAKTSKLEYSTSGSIGLAPTYPSRYDWSIGNILNQIYNLDGSLIISTTNSLTPWPDPKINGARIYTTMLDQLESRIFSTYKFDSQYYEYSGLDNKIYEQSSYDNTLYATFDPFARAIPLKDISANLPQAGQFYGADESGNLIIQPNGSNSIRCYFKNMDYTSSMPPSSNLSDIKNQSIRSVYHLYSKNTVPNESFFDFNKQSQNNPFVYQVGTSNNICGTVPIGLVVSPDGNHIIITKKYTAIHTNQHIASSNNDYYLYIPPEYTSSGENDDTGI